MPDYDDVRYYFFIKKCPNGVGVQCTQMQVYARVPWKLYLGGSWVDVGKPVCAACPPPTGPIPTNTVIACCFDGAFFVSVEPLSPPGLVGELPDLSGLLGELPPGAALRPVGVRCLRVDKESCEILLDNMQRALEQLRSTGRLNEAQTQAQAIQCLSAICSRFP